MKKVNALLLVFALFLAIAVTAHSQLTGNEQNIDKIAGIEQLENGQTWLARYQENEISLDRLNVNGVSNSQISISRKQGDAFLSVADICVAPDGQVLVLMDLFNETTGSFIGQQLHIYDPDKIFFSRVQKCDLTSLSDGFRYRWIEATSGSVVLMATDQRETTLTREAYDLSGLLLNGDLNGQKNRTYPLLSNEGIAQAITVGPDVSYISRSGKAFITSEVESSPRELYSALRLQKVTYPIYMTPETSDSVIIGVQESGDILSLSLNDGSTTLLKSGTEPFSGISGYTPRDVRGMSMVDPQNFAAVVPSAKGFEIILSNEGDTRIVSSVSSGIFGNVLRIALTCLGYFVIFGFIVQALYGGYYTISNSRTILVKLLCTTIPLLMVALVCFGIFSYNVYKQSVVANFQKQVEDEGNLLSALFGTESFVEIEFPYQYTSEAYTYLKQNMATRSIHTATAYYERGSLFTGVDRNYPCAYPFDVRLDREAAELYQQAAFTGRSQTGVIRDVAGERLSCVTPIGGGAGDTVYLLETGILMSNLDRYTSSYLRSYVMIAVLFIAAISGILMLIFMKILRPLGEIKEGIEAFSYGNRAVRLVDHASDEFSDIIRVFNKMANDIDAQIYSLQIASETYYRFIPQKMLELLGKDNLGEVELGNGKEQDCCVLCVSLALKSDNLSRLQEQELTNRFFNILNLSCDRHGGVLMSDGVNLRKMRILCPEGDESAVQIALETLTRTEALNATLPLQNRLSALLVAHHAPSYYGICGDNDRLIPALISPQLDRLADCEDSLRAISSRLIVTESAMEGVEKSSHFYRFIGCLEDVGVDKIGLYDFYDAASPEETRLINDTLSTFDKGLELYRQGRFYDAKNLFALVLRTNQYDNVARHYIFRAERKL